MFQRRVIEPPELWCVIYVDFAAINVKSAKLQPVLHVMLQKAYDAHKYFQEQEKLAPTEDQGVDELLCFGGIKQQGRTTPGESQSRITRLPINVPTRPQSQDRSASSSLSAPAPHTTYPTARPRSDSGVLLTYAGKPQPEAITLLTYPAMSALMTYLQVSNPTQYTSSPLQRTPDMLSNQTFADLSGEWNDIYNEYPGLSYTVELSTSGGTTAAQPQNLQTPPTWQVVPRRLPMPSSGSAPSWVAQQRSPVEIDPFILDDRWASFNNYGSPREPMSAYQQP